ncbi:MAG: hypothetical protein AAF211_16540 [Myxococcota bacterium]
MIKLGCRFVVMLAVGCTGTDVGGCPLDLSEAAGESCSEEGLECGEFSLCDPCTSDLSECEQITCQNGTWVTVEPETVCDAS